MDTREGRAAKALRKSSLSESLLADGKTVRIPLTHGKFALVDIADFPLIADVKWHAVRSFKKWYAATHSNGRTLMHRLLMGKGVDHVSRNGLDNRRENLRYASKSQNQANRAIPSSNTSGYKGVGFYKGQAKPWKARIRVNRQLLHLGYFANPDDASRAYDQAAVEHFGEFALLNFSTKGVNHGCNNGIGEK